MRRARLFLLTLAAIAVAQLLTACVARDLVADTVAEDAKHGAAVGFTIGGPEGAAIGSVAMAAIGVFVRWKEKRTLRRKGLLTDKIVKPRGGDRRGDAARPSDSGEFPQQSIHGA